MTLTYSIISYYMCEAPHSHPDALPQLAQLPRLHLYCYHDCNIAIIAIILDNVILYNTMLCVIIS